MPPRATLPRTVATKDWYQTLDPPEVKRRVDAFVSGAEDASKLSECPVCLRFFVRALMERENAALLAYAVRQLSQFFDAALRLIVVLPDVDLPALRIRLVENQQRCRHRRTSHKVPRVGGSSDALATLLTALYILIDGGLKKGPNPLYRHDASGNRKHFCKRKEIWPRRLQDIFQAGLERTLDALVFWACVPFAPHPFHLLYTYLLIAGPVVTDTLLQPPRRERLAWATLQALTAGSAVPWPVNCAVPIAPRRGLSAPEGLRGSKGIVDGAMYMLYVLCVSHNGRATDPLRLVAGLETAFHGTLQRLMRDARQSKINRDTAGLYLCMLSEHPIARCPVREFGRALYVRAYLKRCATAYRCSTPGCSRHELGDPEQEGPERPTRFARCGKCMVMRYCGLSCQRAHWEATAPSHRQVCRVIRTLTAQGADVCAGDSKLILEAYGRLPPEDAELLFQAACSCTFMPYDRHRV